MCIVLAEQQNAALAHEIDYLRIRCKDAQAGEVLNFIRESAGVIDGAIDVEAVLLANHKVVMAVTGRGVDQSGSGFTSG